MVMAEAVQNIKALIKQTEQWRAAHKARGQAGMIEALGSDIRIKALREALAVVVGAGNG